MSKVVRPPIPYHGPITDGIHEGKQIKIKGIVPVGADKFTVNLTSGLDSNSDRPLHLSIRLNKNVVVRNTRIQKSYGKEETKGCFPFTKGSEFTMVILVEANMYKISVNGQHCWDYNHRLHISRACSVLIEGDVVIEFVEYLNKYQQPAVCPPSVGFPPSVGYPPSSISGGSTSPQYKQPAVCPSSVGYPSLNIYGDSTPPPTQPYIFPLHGGIRPGTSIYISGRPTSTPHNFSINLQSGAGSYPPPDIAFHFDVRFVNYNVVRNSRINGSWLAEETMIPHFPFQPGCHFDLIIKVQNDMYVVMLNGQHFITFRHRSNAFPQINILSIENDVVITSIRLD